MLHELASLLGRLHGLPAAGGAVARDGGSEEHDGAFFVTTPSPCPYLTGKTERKVFTELTGQHAAELNDALGRIGFRRQSHVDYDGGFRFDRAQRAALVGGGPVLVANDATGAALSPDALARDFRG